MQGAEEPVGARAVQPLGEGPPAVEVVGADAEWPVGQRHVVELCPVELPGDRGPRVYTEVGVGEEAVANADDRASAGVPEPPGWRVDRDRLPVRVEPGQGDGERDRPRPAGLV